MPLFSRPSRTPFGPALRWAWAIASTLFMAGLYLDGWAHINVPQLETFFTPWHAVFYSGFAITAGILLVEILRRKQQVDSWSIAVPAGQGLTLLGIAIFALGGLGDMAWHIVFGVEADIEALLSPTHLMLATGMFLIVSGGMRDEWARGDEHTQNFFRGLPYVLSIASTFAGVIFLIQFGEYTDFAFAKEMMSRSGSLQFYQQANPILGALVFSALLVGTLSMALRKNRLPFGTVATVLGLVVTGLSLNRGGTNYIPAALLAGLLGDILLEIAEWSRNRERWLRFFSFALPFSYYAFVIGTLAGISGTWLTVHVLAGIPVLAGISGLLTGTLAFSRDE